MSIRVESGGLLPSGVGCRVSSQVIQDGIAVGREALDLLDELGFTGLKEGHLDGLTLAGRVNQNPFQIEEPERSGPRDILPSDKTFVSHKRLGRDSVGENDRGAESGEHPGADE